MEEFEHEFDRKKKTKRSRRLSDKSKRSKRLDKALKARSLKISNSSQINIDLSQENGIEDAYQWSKELNPDIFFHCAGSNPITPLVYASSKIYKDCFNLHFLSASQICRGCLESRNKDYFLKIFLIFQLHQ